MLVCHVQLLSADNNRKSAASTKPNRQIPKLNAQIRAALNFDMTRTQLPFSLEFAEVFPM